MGLDMYLYVDEYVSRKHWDKRDENGEAVNNPQFEAIASVLQSTKHIQEDSWTGLTIQVPVGYWRKANAIHGWIVNNYADGVDECQEIGLPRVALEDLLNTCKKVLVNPDYADELLPPQSGFFFGSTEVDEYYIHDLKYTVELLEGLLKDEALDWFIYRASW
jgi:hypothetical protein